MKLSKEETVGTETFGKLWKSCFSYVKIRAQKAVTGKCEGCAYLSHSRKTYHDAKSREYITMMHALHRTMYMGERMEYYKRRQEALLYPEAVWSVIGDGMAQQHCQLPYLAGLKDLDKLPQHLQGMLCHGKLMRIYRTFHNVKNDSNSAMHCFLLTLEYLMHKNGGNLPDTVYYQIDGGSENSAKAMFGLAELIIAKRLIRKLVITRLPVGHTHEDIDAMFAKIWVHVRPQHVATMNAYKKRIEEALGSNEKQPIDVIDIFAVPDYCSYLKPFIDAKFGRYCKTKWTQLQWMFEHTEVCLDFPLGVKTSYRAYCADSVKEITIDHDQKYGFKCQDVHVQWFPEATNTEPSGMYLLQRIPTGVIEPEEFIENSRAELERVVGRIQHHYAPSNNNVGVPPEVNRTCHGDPIVAEWIDFATNIAPLSDSVEEYCSIVPLHIPFLKELFNDHGEPFVNNNPIEQTKITKALEVKALNSVTWSRRGIARHKNDPANTSARLPIRPPSIDDVETQSNDEQQYNYRLLSSKEISQNKELYKFKGKQFTDTNDDGSLVVGVVNDVVLEIIENSVCFEYSTYDNASEDVEPQYIFAHYAVQNCKWLHDHKKRDKTSGENDDDNHDRQPAVVQQLAPKKVPAGWRGYTAVDPSETVAIPLLEQNLMLAPGSSRRKLPRISL